MTDYESQAGRVWERYGYRILATTALMVLIGGTVVFRFLEDWSWVDAFYFSSIAGTTVGFGDLVPTTDPGKLFTVAYIFAAVGLLGTVLAERSRRQAKTRAARFERRRGHRPSADDPPNGG